MNVSPTLTLTKTTSVTVVVLNSICFSLSLSHSIEQNLFSPINERIKKRARTILVPQNPDDNDSACRIGEIKCVSDGKCIESYKFCNGVNDCEDGSDEDLCSGSSGVLFIAYIFFSSTQFVPL